MKQEAKLHHTPTVIDRFSLDFPLGNYSAPPSRYNASLPPLERPVIYVLSLMRVEAFGSEMCNKRFRLYTLMCSSIPSHAHKIYEREMPGYQNDP